MGLFSSSKDIVLRFDATKRSPHAFDKTFTCGVSEQKYEVTVSALFSPNQDLHNKFFRTYMPKAKKYWIPFGGDIFTCFTTGSFMNVMALDISGHGIQPSKLAEHLIQYAIDHRDDPEILNTISKYWISKEAVIKKKIAKELATLQEQLVPSYYKNGILQYLENRPAIATGVQAFFDFNAQKITFYNLGHPGIYFVFTEPGGETKVENFMAQDAPIGVDPAPISQGSTWTISQYDKFRLVVFTDGVNDTSVQLNKDFIANVVISSANGDIQDQGLIDAHEALLDHVRQVDGRKVADMAEEVVKKLRTTPAPEVRDFFYDYLKGENTLRQYDDITFVVMDFQRL